MRWNRVAPHSSLHCPHERAPIVGHAIRAITERQPDMTVLSIDGIGAYDCLPEFDDVQVDGRGGPPEVVAQPSRNVWEINTG